LLKAFHDLQDTARGYSLTQLLGRPTIKRYHAFVGAHVPPEPARRILEIGCGLGSARPWFRGTYTGVDINPEYIAKARENFQGDFHVMDAARLTFLPDQFDDAVSIATAHHLTDEQLGAMVRGALTAAASLHVIDPVLPITSPSLFKMALFRMDRGQHLRTFNHLRGIVHRDGRVKFSEIAQGPLHDVCYIRVCRF
jgi:SAM-dependent methyltransferase